VRHEVRAHQLSTRLGATPVPASVLNRVLAQRCGMHAACGSYVTPNCTSLHAAAPAQARPLHPTT
jgi:hypothetical protein